jgi:hypothetical protein
LTFKKEDCSSNLCGISEAMHRFKHEGCSFWWRYLVQIPGMRWGRNGSSLEVVVHCVHPCPVIRLHLPWPFMFFSLFASAGGDCFSLWNPILTLSYLKIWRRFLQEPWGFVAFKPLLSDTYTIHVCSDCVDWYWITNLL